MRLLLDEMYPRRLAEQLRSAGFDVIAVVEVPELVGSSDADIARQGLRDGRTVVTENVVDFALLDVEAHAGLLLVNARRWPRTPNGRPRLLTALHNWLEARGNRDPREPGVVEWL